MLVNAVALTRRSFPKGSCKFPSSIPFYVRLRRSYTPFSFRGGIVFTFRVSSRQLKALKLFSIKKIFYKNYIKKLYEKKNLWSYGQATPKVKELLLIDMKYITWDQGKQGGHLLFFNLHIASATLLLNCGSP